MIPIVWALAAAMVVTVCSPTPTPTPSTKPSPSTPAPQPSPRPSPTPGMAGIVYSQGFEAGPVSSRNTPGLRVISDPSIVMEWQDAVVRTGSGAYHLRGGNLRGDASIHNQGKASPFGGLEVWVGGAFYFVSFPHASTRDPVWLMATVPTDGVRGADDKPVAAIDASGRLSLLGSNSRSSSELDVPLQRNRWYYLVLHGVNGTGETQELHLYDGASGALLGRTSLVLDVTGTFTNPLTKWGFGTSQNSAGLEYYLDDIYHAIGGTNPGPLRVEPGREIVPEQRARGASSKG